MRNLTKLIEALLSAAVLPAARSERGAVLAEYVMLVGFIAIVVMVGVSALGLAVEPLFHTVAPTI